MTDFLTLTGNLTSDIDLILSHKVNNGVPFTSVDINNEMRMKGFFHSNSSVSAAIKSWFKYQTNRTGAKLSGFSDFKTTLIDVDSVFEGKVTTRKAFLYHPDTFDAWMYSSEYAALISPENVETINVFKFITQNVLPYLYTRGDDADLDVVDIFDLVSEVKTNKQKLLSILFRLNLWGYLLSNNTDLKNSKFYTDYIATLNTQAELMVTRHVASNTPVFNDDQKIVLNAHYKKLFAPYIKFDRIPSNLQFEWDYYQNLKSN